MDASIYPVQLSRLPNLSHETNAFYFNTFHTFIDILTYLTLTLHYTYAAVRKTWGKKPKQSKSSTAEKVMTSKLMNPKTLKFQILLFPIFTIPSMDLYSQMDSFSKMTRH